MCLQTSGLVANNVDGVFTGFFVGTHSYRLGESLPLCTHNLYFGAKALQNYPKLPHQWSLIWTSLFKYRIYPKCSDKHTCATSVDVDQTPQRRRLILVYTVCHSSSSTAHIDQYIMKTCLHNFDPLKSPFYTEKVGLQGYTLFFLFLLKTYIVGTR